MESVVPDLSLRPEIGAMWCDAESSIDDSQPAFVAAGEWRTALGFAMVFRGEGLGAFQVASTGSDAERIEYVALELMSQVQDLVAVATTEPWPLVIVNNRRDMAMPNARVEGNRLHMWYGDSAVPALRLPSVDLI